MQVPLRLIPLRLAGLFTALPSFPFTVDGSPFLVQPLSSYHRDAFLFSARIIVNLHGCYFQATRKMKTINRNSTSSRDWSRGRSIILTIIYLLSYTSLGLNFSFGFHIVLFLSSFLLAQQIILLVGLQHLYVVELLTGLGFEV